MVRSIVGANWGDEGKGKITDVMAENSDIVVRFQGGANAGHTIINDYGKFALHLLPSGVFHSNIVNVIGPGVALDVERFLAETPGVSLEPFSLPGLGEIPEGMLTLWPHIHHTDGFFMARIRKHQGNETTNGR